MSNKLIIGLKLRELFFCVSAAATPFLLNVNFDGSESMSLPEYYDTSIATAGECSVLRLANPLVTCTWKSGGCYCSFPSAAADTANTGFCLSYKQIPEA